LTASAVEKTTWVAVRMLVKNVAPLFENCPHILLDINENERWSRQPIRLNVRRVLAGRGKDVGEIVTLALMFQGDK
jgi:hypothetical protein